MPGKYWRIPCRGQCQRLRPLSAFKRCRASLDSMVCGQCYDALELSHKRRVLEGSLQSPPPPNERTTP